MKRTPLKSYGARRRKRDKEGLVYGDYHLKVRRFPCMIGVGCTGDVVGHHVKAVGAGGLDMANEVPLCWWHHGEVHDWGRPRFERKYGVSLEQAAKEYAQSIGGTA